MAQLVTFQGYPVCLSDAGRSSSSHPLDRNDCSVRSLAIAADLSYDTAWDIIKGSGKRKYRQGIDDTWYTMPGWFSFADAQRVHALLPLMRRFVFREYSFPSQVGKRRMHPAQFIKDFPQGRFILSESEHVDACVDGVIYNDRIWTRKEGGLKTFRVIYNAYKPVEVPPLASLYTAYRKRPGKRTKRLGVVFGLNPGAAKLQALGWYSSKYDDEAIDVRALV